MSLRRFKYSDGRQMEKGDRVLVDGTRQAVVSAIVQPGSTEALEFSCPDGGFFLDFDDGDAQLWPHADQDIEFLNRQNE